MVAALRWGVVGVGRAGRARAAALAADPRAVAVGGWRGEPAAAGLLAFDALEALIAAVDAVAICAPDVAHAALSRAALEAGRHVLCEYPGASSAAEAAALFGLAGARGRVLHVAHIGLLGPAPAWLRAHAVGRRLLRGEVRFTGGPRRGVSSAAHANLARLHRLLDVAGPVEAVEVHARGPDRLAATVWAQGAPVRLDFATGEGLKRQTALVLEYADGPVRQMDTQLWLGDAPVRLPPGEGLFLTDQRQCTAQILDGAPPPVPHARQLEALALADRLDAAPISPAARPAADPRPWP